MMNQTAAFMGDLPEVFLKLVQEKDGRGCNC